MKENDKYVDELMDDKEKVREAIEILKNEKPGCGEKRIFTEEEKCEAYDIAISAIEKQISKKVVDRGLVKDNGIVVGFAGRCPSCNEIIDDTSIVCDCGQKLDWR